MREELRTEIELLVSGINKKEEKWLAVHEILNRYRARPDFPEIRRQICLVMNDLAGD